MRRIGVLLPGDGLGFVPLTQALGDLGWTDGRNVRMDPRFAGNDINRIQALAQELVGLQPDIIETRSLTFLFENRISGLEKF